MVIVSLILSIVPEFEIFTNSEAEYFTGNLLFNGVKFISFVIELYTEKTRGDGYRVQNK